MTRKHRQAAWAVLTDSEEKRLLETTRQAKDREAFRDYVLLSTALATALRVHELAALHVEHVLTPTGRIKQVVDLPVAKNDSNAPAYLGEPIRLRLAAWVEELARRHGGTLDRGAALWPSGGSRSGERGRPMAVRTMQAMLKKRLAAAGIGRRARFHDLRHTAISRVAEKTEGNIPVVAKFARHRDWRTTATYTHAPQGAVLAAADLAMVG